MKEYRLALVGFGNVGQALAQLLETKQDVLRAEYGFSTRIVSIATLHHGMAIDPAGTRVRALVYVAQGPSFGVVEVPVGELGAELRVFRNDALSVAEAMATRISPGLERLMLFSQSCAACVAST